MPDSTSVENPLSVNGNSGAEAKGIRDPSLGLTEGEKDLDMLVATWL